MPCLVIYSYSRFFFLFFGLYSYYATSQEGNDDELWQAECDLTAFYSYQSLLNIDAASLALTPPPPNKADLQALLERTHRRVLPYTDKENDDVWKALLDLDGDPVANTVSLIYVNDNLSNARQLQGVAAGWNREHLWPQSLGVENNPAAYTDIHHLVPSDWNVNAARSNKWFGEMEGCNTAMEAQNDASCRIPAHAQAAMDTAATSNAFLPPVAARGRIARALLYMDMRYNGMDGEINLQLSDCIKQPQDNQEKEESGIMGYRAQLLTWHDMYPVTQAEQRRNQRACARWQGNRNPFVDFPHWVTPLFGSNATLTCPETNNNTTTDETPNNPPVGPPSTTNSTCPPVGSMLFIGVNTDNPDDVAIVTLQNLTAGATLYITDNAYQDGTLTTNEGTRSMKLTKNITEGTVLLGLDMWEATSGSLALSATGETLFLYCLDNDDNEISDSTGNNNPAYHWIAGISLAGPWQSTANNGGSALPFALAQASLALDHVDNARYIGPTRGTPATLRKAILQSSNWEGRNNERYEWDVSSWIFQIKSNVLALLAAWRCSVLLVTLLTCWML